MGAFEYTALDAQGKERKGLIEGDTPKHVRQLLREKHLLPMDIQEAARREQRRSGAGPRFVRRSLSSLDLALLTRQFAIVGAGANWRVSTLRAVWRHRNSRSVYSSLVVFERSEKLPTALQSSSSARASV